MEKVDNPDPSKNTILAFTETPGIRSQGDTDYSCAGCGKTMFRRVDYKQVLNVICKCPHCGTHSRIPAVHHSN